MLFTEARVELPPDVKATPRVEHFTLSPWFGWCWWVPRGKQSPPIDVSSPGAGFVSSTCLLFYRNGYRIVRGKTFEGAVLLRRCCPRKRQSLGIKYSSWCSIFLFFCIPWCGCVSILRHKMCKPMLIVPFFLHPLAPILGVFRVPPLGPFVAYRPFFPFLLANLASFLSGAVFLETCCVRPCPVTVLFVAPPRYFPASFRLKCVGMVIQSWHLLANKYHGSRRFTCFPCQSWPKTLEGRAALQSFPSLMSCRDSD